MGPRGAAAPTRRLLSHGLFPWAAASSRACHLCGVPHRLLCGYLLRCGLHHVLQGSLCSGTWSCSSSCSTGLGVCRAVSHPFLTPVNPGVSPEVPPFWPRGSVLSCVGLLGDGCVQHRAVQASPQRLLLQTPTYKLEVVRNGGIGSLDLNPGASSQSLLYVVLSCPSLLDGWSA